MSFFNIAFAELRFGFIQLLAKFLSFFHNVSSPASVVENVMTASVSLITYKQIPLALYHHQEIKG